MLHTTFRQINEDESLLIYSAGTKGNYKSTWSHLEDRGSQQQTLNTKAVQISKPGENIVLFSLVVSLLALYFYILPYAYKMLDSDITVLSQAVSFQTRQLHIPTKAGLGTPSGLFLNISDFQ